jgi:ATP-binding cassette subfamily B protein
LIVVAFVTAMAAAAPDALFAAGLAELVRGVVARDATLIMLAASGLGVLATASWLLNVVSDRANRRFADRASVAVESHIARLQSAVVTIEHHERPDFMDRLSVLRDHAGALTQLYQQLFATFGAILRLVITLGLLMSVQPILGVLGVLALPAVLVSNWRAGLETAVEEAGAQDDRRARHLFTLGTTAAPGKELRVARVQAWLREQRRASWADRFVPLSRTRWTSAVWQSIAHGLFGVAFVLAVVYVARGGGQTTGNTMLVLAAGSRLSQYIGQTVSQTQFFRTIWLDASRRLAWLEDFAAANLAVSDLPAPDRIADGIRLDHVSFRYPGTERLVLDDVSVAIPAGRVIAVVGENGAGKSSLVKLLCAFYSPTSGRITVDGTDLGRIRPDSWRARLSGAFQDFFQFEYQIRQSVGLGDLARVDDPEAVLGALERAGAEDVMSKMDSGLDTQLGASWTNGVDLSHGQWQKIALARAFMRANPLLLVLDEPTSALDPETEHALFVRYAEAARAADDVRSGRITVLVSHRFSTVRMADIILVLDGSRLVEQGSHAELMALDGQYADLYRIQAASYGTAGRR